MAGKERLLMGLSPQPVDSVAYDGNRRAHPPGLVCLGKAVSGKVFRIAKKMISQRNEPRTRTLVIDFEALREYRELNRTLEGGKEGCESDKGRIMRKLKRPVARLA
jgi:hypothetical protein